MNQHAAVSLKWLAGAVVVALLFAVWLYRRDAAPAGAPMGEVVSADEQYQTAEIVAAAVGLSASNRAALLAEGAAPKHLATSAETAPGYSPETYRRDVHSKSHGCVLADFAVNRVQDRFAYGVFAAPAHYDAIIRFSSGNPALQSDSKRDARGFAIKLLNVPGTKLLDFEEQDQTQDFVMMNNPTFFIRTLAEYRQFSDALGRGQAMSYFIPSIWHPLSWHLREMREALGTFKPRPDSLVTTRFWSASAYALGPQQYVKYSVLPCAANHPMPPKNANDPKVSYDYLRLELANQAAAGGACFDFAVQPQVLGKNMPVEDTTVEWSEKASPFIPVARITLKKAPNNTEEMNDRCESLSFNPWHSLPAHRPAGAMNRVRKVLYQAMAQFRRTKNCEPLCRTKCGGGAAYDACMARCPLLQDPVPESMALPVGACEAPKAAPAMPVSAAGGG